MRSLAAFQLSHWLITDSDQIYENSTSYAKISHRHAYSSQIQWKLILPSYILPQLGILHGNMMRRSDFCLCNMSPADSHHRMLHSLKTRSWSMHPDHRVVTGGSGSTVLEWNDNYLLNNHCSLFMELKMCACTWHKHARAYSILIVFLMICDSPDFSVESSLILEVVMQSW